MQWLSPAAYDALSQGEKADLAKRRKAQAASAWPSAAPNPRRPSGQWQWWRYPGLVGLTVAALIAGGSLFNLFPGSERTPLGLGAVSLSFGFCHTGGGTNCVVDGDTIWFQGQKIRIADIDAPETHDPQCASEKALGDRATARLHELVNSGPVSLKSIDRDEDRYGRKLRIVEVNGDSVGDTLVGKGLARWYEGGRRPWC